MSLFTDKQFFVLIGVIGVGAYLIYREREKFNPSNSGNVVNQAVESIGRDLTGDEHFTVGGWLWEVFNGDEFERKYNEGLPP